MNMSIDTTRFAAAAHPVAEVDFGQQRKEQMMAHQAMMQRIEHQRFAADYIAHVQAAATNHKLNRLA